MHAALDAGVMLIDTALAYTCACIESYAEQVIACALRGLTTARPLIAKRGPLAPGRQLPGRRAARHPPRPLRGQPAQLEADRIELYQLHHVDPQVPLPTAWRTVQLRREGKIAAIGLSNVTVAQLDKAPAVAPIAAVQNRLSYGDPGDLPMVLACAERGVAYLAYSPFGGSASPTRRRRSLTASRRGVSAHRVLLAWLRRQSPNIVPLAGASRPASIRDSAARLDLTESDLGTLCASNGSPR